VDYAERCDNRIKKDTLREALGFPCAYLMVPAACREVRDRGKCGGGDRG